MPNGLIKETKTFPYISTFKGQMKDGLRVSGIYITGSIVYKGDFKNNMRSFGTEYTLKYKYVGNF